MEQIVITGATGFLGRNLVNHFLERGCAVWALVRHGSKQMNTLVPHKNLKIIQVEMNQAEAVTAEIGRADVWFHFAWGGVNRDEIDSPEVQLQNIKGSIACLKAARQLGCQVFMDAGSRVEYGVTQQMMSEDLHCNPINAYGKAKLKFYEEASELCREWGLLYYHLRFFSVYGPGDHPWSVVSTLIRELSAERRVPLSACAHKWNFMYIKDAVDAVYQLYKNSKKISDLNPEIINLASEDTRVLKLFVEEIHNLLEGRGVLEYGGFAQAKEGALSICPDISKLKQLSGGFTEAYSFREGILETIEKVMEQTDEKN